MLRKYLLTNLNILTIAIGLIAFSCTDSKSVQGTSFVSDSQTAEKDSVIKEKNDSLVFATAAEAEKYMRNSGHWDRYSQGILPSMAGVSIDYVNRLLNNKHNYFIVVDKRRMKVILFDKYGVAQKTYACAVGRNFGTKHKRSDCRTSEGYFTAEGIYNSTDWLYTDDYGHTSQARGVFGPRFIRLKIPGVSSIGIHGTSSPGSMGRRASHGCIRILNDNILELVKYATVGMPIIVNPGDADRRVNEREGYHIPQFLTRLDGVNDAPVFSEPKPSKKKATATDSISTSEETLPETIILHETETPASSSSATTTVSTETPEKTE